MAKDRVGVATLRPETRDQEREVRHDGTDLGQLCRRGRPDDESHGAPGSPARGPAGDTEIQGLGRRTSRRVRADRQALELGRPAVGRSAQDVGEAIPAIEEWL
jgi:hypothetical protein